MSKLVELYVRQINSGNNTIDDVPQKLKESVQEALNTIMELGGE